MRKPRQPYCASVKIRFRSDWWCWLPRTGGWRVRVPHVRWLCFLVHLEWYQDRDRPTGS